MTRPLGSVLLVAALTGLPTAAYPQLGEVQLGPLVSYGTAAPYGLGGGLVLGVAAGRIAYVGARWTYQAGRTEPSPGPAPPVDVRNRVQLFAVDLGLLFPSGAVEIVPGGSLGVAWFTQRAGTGATTAREQAFKFFGAPGLSVQVRVGGLRLIPEIQYYLTGAPNLTWPASHRGPVASLRVVLPFEVDRIRY